MALHISASASIMQSDCKLNPWYIYELRHSCGHTSSLCIIHNDANETSKKQSVQMVAIALGRYAFEVLQILFFIYNLNSSLHFFCSIKLVIYWHCETSTTGWPTVLHTRTWEIKLLKHAEFLFVQLPCVFVCKMIKNGEVWHRMILG